jgi:hypothetical protein
VVGDVRRSRGSRQWSAHRLWWSELFRPRAQTGELVGGEKLGLNTAVELDPLSRGAPRKVSEVVGARNLGMAHLEVRSTCDSGRLNSGEDDLTVPAGQGLGSSLERLHGLSGKLSKGSGEVGGLREWLAMMASLRRRRWVAERSLEPRAISGRLGAVRRG